MTIECLAAGVVVDEPVFEGIGNGTDSGGGGVLVVSCRHCPACSN